MKLVTLPIFMLLVTSGNIFAEYFAHGAVHRHLRSRANMTTNGDRMLNNSSKSVAFKKLTKTYPKRTSKNFNRNNASHDFNQQLSMRSLNRYQYRRSHSKKIGIPTIEIREKK